MLDEMRVVVVGLVVSACAIDGASSVRPQVAFPTLEPDRRPGPVPIDPYADAPQRPTLVPELHKRTGDHVLSNIELGDPGAVVAMTVRVQVGAYRLPSSPDHQVVAERDQIQRVTIRVQPGAAVTKAERADALRATATIDALAPTIRTAAREATSGARTDRQRVASLVRWVHSNVTYVLSDETVASKVLAHGTGDCSEMSLLFVALARASGIPARRVAGLAATEVDGASAFGFHAWAEVALDGHWVAVDPTWNEPVADATHVALFEGESLEWVAAASELQLAVVDIKRDKTLIGQADARQLASELPVYMRLRR